ncbi:MAG TPA: rRNA maturation RNase YbeY [Candidatus Paceibacterota bacterium]
MTRTVAVTNFTNGKLPRLPFEYIKNAILGASYELSLVFAGDRRMLSLNKRYRKKTYTPNTLSFPLDKNCGEIFINLNRIPVEAPRYQLSERGYIAFLFIHGLFHLEGLKHGATMDKKEQEMLKQFNIR